MVDVTPGDDGANEGFWRFQIRDKYGRWVQMGGAVTFTTDHPNFGRITGTGLFEGGSRPGYAMVRIKGHASLKDGVYEVAATDMETVRAIIPEDAPGLIEAKKLDAADGITDTAPISPQESSELKDLTGFTKISGQKGSNTGGLFEDPSTGEKFYVKFEKSIRVDNEVLASRLYKKTGLNAIEVEKGIMDGQTISYSKWEDGATADLIQQLRQWPALAQKLKEGYAVDAWLGNWDVVGLEYDNLIFDKNGQDLRVDPGGALLYRAQGARKGDAFTDVVGELDTYEDKAYTTSRIYGNLSEADKVSSAKRLLEVSDSEIDSMVDATISDAADNALLKKRLKNRRQYILDKFGIEEKTLDDRAQELARNKNFIKGTEALAKIKSAAGLKAKKDEGRFPIPRSGADIRAAAKEQYSGVFDTLKAAYPALVSNFPDYESFWSYAQKDMAVTVTSRYKDSVDEIPELMRKTNEIYAKKILGINSEGTITFYRNATNNSGTTEKSAAGYATMDPNMAYSYNSNKDNTEGNGRYEIAAKPGEVYGLLGLSDAEDEYGVVIGPDVTRDGAKRVGDLAVPEVAPWITPDMFDVGGGGDGPFRFFRTSAHFDFIALDKQLLPGDSYADFYAANGLSQGAIPEKFDELYGAGAFEEMRGESGTPNYGRMQSYFMETPDGKYGLNPLELDKLLQTTVPVGEYDQMDTTLKMLSTIQELTGKPFMVHRGHKQDDSRIIDVVKTSATPTAIVQEAPKAALTEEEIETLLRFTDSGYARVSNKLRRGMEVSAQDEADIATLVNLINSSKTEEDRVLYRGTFTDNASWAEELNNIQIGDVVVDPGIESTSSDLKVADFFAKMNTGSTPKARALFTLNVPKGSSAFDIPPKAHSYSKVEMETLLPPNTSIKVTGIEERDGVKYITADVIDVVDEEAWKKTEDGSEVRGILTLSDKITGVSIDLDTIASPVSSEMLNEATTLQKEAIDNYSSQGYKPINSYLRSPDTYAYEAGTPVEDVKKMIVEMDDLLESSSITTTSGRVFRGMNFYSTSDEMPTDWGAVMKDMQVGDTISDPGYVSASNDPVVAFSSFGPGFWNTSWLEDGTAETNRNVSLGSAFMAINVPKGSRALVLSEDLGLRTTESEVLLPRDSQFRVTGIRRVQQVENGEPVKDTYNYYVEADLVPQDTPGIIDVVDESAEERGAVDAPISWTSSNGVEGRGSSALLDKGLTKDLISYGEFTSPVPVMDPEMFTMDQKRSLKGYTGVDYKHVNKLLRTGQYAEGLKNYLEVTSKILDEAIEENGIIEAPARVFRGMTIKPRTGPEDTETDWAAVMKDLGVGDIFSDKGYMSTSNDPSISHEGFASGQTTKKSNFDLESSPSNNIVSSSNGTIFWSIDLPVGTKALAIPEEFGVSGDEKEVLLARGTSLKVKAIRRVKQDRDDGIEAYNYYIEAEATNE